MMGARSPLAQARADMRAMREYSRWAQAKVDRLGELHGMNVHFQAYSWNSDQTDIRTITAYIALAPSGRCNAFYIVGEGCKDASVICETPDEVFTKLVKWQEDRLERARKTHITEFEKLVALQAKVSKGGY